MIPWQVPSIGPLPEIKVYECGKCQARDFANIQLLWAHFEKCGTVDNQYYIDCE